MNADFLYVIEHKTKISFNWYQCSCQLLKIINETIEKYGGIDNKQFKDFLKTINPNNIIYDVKNSKFLLKDVHKETLYLCPWDSLNYKYSIFTTIYYLATGKWIHDLNYDSMNVVKNKYERLCTNILSKENYSIFFHYNRNIKKRNETNINYIVKMTELLYKSDAI